MKKPVRFLIYMGILGLTWYIVSPALSVNFGKVGAPVRELTNGWSTLAIGGATLALALLITYLVTSGWGLIFLSGLAFCGLVVLGVLHPYLFPLLIPLTALWVACAMARRKEAASRA